MKKVDGLIINLSQYTNLIVPEKYSLRMWRMLKKCHVTERRYHPGFGNYDQLEIERPIIDARFEEISVYSEADFEVISESETLKNNLE